MHTWYPIFYPFHDRGAIALFRNCIRRSRYIRVTPPVSASSIKPCPTWILFMNHSVLWDTLLVSMQNPQTFVGAHQTWSCNSDEGNEWMDVLFLPCYSRFPSCHMNGDFPRSDAFENTDGLGVGQTVGGVAIDGKDFITWRQEKKWKWNPSKLIKA